MRTRHSLVFLLSTFAAIFLMSSAAWAGDVCQDAVNKAALELQNKGGVCRSLASKFKTAAGAAHSLCRSVRDQIRMCWNNYRKAKATCDKISKFTTRRDCVRAAKSARKACVDKIKNGTNYAMCKDKRRYAAKCGMATAGSCGAVIYVAAGTCVVYWAGVLLGAIVGK